jgi:hypothetical protein
MGILFRKTGEVFITPTLPSSFPYLKVIRDSLFIVLNGRREPYLSLDNYLKVMKGAGVIVKTTEELSSVLGVSLIEISDNQYLVNESLHYIQSLSTLLEALCVRQGTVNTQKKNYSLYFDLFKNYFHKGRFLTQRDVGVIKDYEGKVFSSISEMCKYHKITTQTYYSRKARGIKGRYLFKKERFTGR